MYTKDQICKALDLAVLKPTATTHDVAIAAELVEQHHIATVCVAPIFVAQAKKVTHRVACVIGFPHGNHMPNIKVHEAIQAIDDGATELDVVLNYGQFLDGNTIIVSRELDLIVPYAMEHGVRVKAILESCYYTIPELKAICELCVAKNVDWVKTSTGYAEHGATPEAVKTMLEAVRGSNTQVKASGGIKDYHYASYYLSLGCTRLGASKYWELLPSDKDSI